MDNFKCDHCLREVNTLYEGWFKTYQSLNPYAKGTATSGLLQNKRLCKLCLLDYKELGLTKANIDKIIFDASTLISLPRPTKP